MYRTEDDLAEGRAHDRCRSSATAARGGVLTDGIEAELAAEIKALVEDATDYAEAEPDRIQPPRWMGVRGALARRAAPPWHGAVRGSGAAGAGGGHG